MLIIFASIACAPSDTVTGMQLIPKGYGICKAGLHGKSFEAKACEVLTKMSPCGREAVIEPIREISTATHIRKYLVRYTPYNPQLTT